MIIKNQYGEILQLLNLRCQDYFIIYDKIIITSDYLLRFLTSFNFIKCLCCLDAFADGTPV